MTEDLVREALDKRRITDETFMWDESHVDTIVQACEARLEGFEDKDRPKVIQKVVNNIKRYKNGQPVIRAVKQNKTLCQKITDAEKENTEFFHQNWKVMENGS